jgi:D-ribose pyranose/furanose isomerase RbsD
VPSLDQVSALRRRPRPKFEAKQMILGTPRPSFRRLLSFLCKEIHAEMVKSIMHIQTQQVSCKQLQKTRKNCKNREEIAKNALKTMQKMQKTHDKLSKTA